MDEGAPALVGPEVIHRVAIVLDFLGYWVQEVVFLGWRKVVVVQEGDGVVVVFVAVVVAVGVVAMVSVGS